MATAGNGATAGLNGATHGILGYIARYGVATVFATIFLVYFLWMNYQLSCDMATSLREVSNSQVQIAQMVRAQTDAIAVVNNQLGLLRAGVVCIDRRP